MSHSMARLVALSLAISALASGAILKGVVRNGTVGKVAGGDRVILLSWSASLSELADTIADPQGRFQFTVPDLRTARLVRVLHQGVAYHVLAAAGTSSVKVSVYDSSPTPDGVIATLAVERFQAADQQLQVIDEISVRNSSNPPNTFVRAFELELPSDAKVVAGRVQAAGGPPVWAKPTPGSGPGRYYFSSPLLPGDTRFAVAYLLPYPGQTVIHPKFKYPLERFIVVLPKSMNFEATDGAKFDTLPGQQGSSTQELAAVNANQLLAFRLSGTAVQAGAANRPQPVGVGVGNVSTTPPARAKSFGDIRWMFLGGFGVVAAGCVAGFLANRRKQSGNTAV